MKKQSATKKRLKVKDMPRKQQMAVKASMAEQAAGKKSPNKFIRTGRTKDTGVVGKVTEKIIHHGFKKMYDQYKGAKKIYNYLKGAPKGSASTGFDGLKKKKSPAKAKTEAAKRLLKAVPNQAAYDKLSAIEKKEFNKAAKKAKLPMKNVASALKMKTSPALAKLSSSCKAAAKRKFKVYPSAYANMWASKTQKAGKC